MKKMRPMPDALKNRKSFSRREFAEAMTSAYGLTAPQIAYDLKKRLDQGTIVRVGWGQYSLMARKKYRHPYSEQAMIIVQTLCRDYDELTFQIFELRQLNDFMNHQIAHNTIFVSIEHDLVNYVFETLWKEYPGKVLLKPKVDEYYRYRQDNEIIVGRLPSETPKGYEQPWKSRLEKILIDVYTDKLISAIVPDGEKAHILDGAFREYMLDENTMIRYAKRKGAEKKVKQILSEYEKAAAV